MYFIQSKKKEDSKPLICVLSAPVLLIFVLSRASTVFGCMCLLSSLLVLYSTVQYSTVNKIIKCDRVDPAATIHQAKKQEEENTTKHHTHQTTETQQRQTTHNKESKCQINLNRERKRKALSNTDPPIAIDSLTNNTLETHTQHTTPQN
jgi:hypothetical protein